ncbi:MAG: hypothetical protein A2725_04065 [Candidatus Magasanikbacteria bacterium RIFCSPHIGHO2_01_FULL_33_34]|uniref:UDP-N-acetylmuramyl-tripeptide synthetase n=1 Tax=Candidatus Magasanikbacteria bacterium RIFCSPHIGHO2_01_FULL_33_34 TaxID=1798671 RepID=A0A1F6LHX8_9BACT|nr:MAG: hypothetical protein A2725_04065 [Candidatus Magasanikbacteria bacterium RIFCSPHIGHO2_01_FULL_33_34]OGH65143.1 MAG: hypothetical protein A3B83_03825 [Candidatus Magasanikbacteria bacterium RIFCSPHIGHO2_02_FULL_33_17]OGH75313.1 MAG: hypothetical protein A3A89_04340 [Candidatus Magasanikbacteria bacterium RIFCSPLOWO2_01_FULL_33_34]OGH81710.1 MAG: hypothetical protein A3F93_03100 [Candidatus Magasanikbacteria bacterium RIFCSPLOWO2_12_FULL_34_7]
MNIKGKAKKIIPKSLLNLRHLFYAWLGSVIYRWPSNKIYVIGVTGTSGKSTTVYLLRQLLESVGYKVGALSTIEFCVAGKCKLNDKKMTMLGKMAIQKYLRKMVDNDCKIAIIETTSEGRIQHRHRFINYDTIALTNLYPEHIESHGSFDNYKKAKLDIFEYVSKCKKKNISLVENDNKFEKISILNAEIEHKKEFLKFDFDKKMTFGHGGEFVPVNINIGKDGLSFAIGEHKFKAPLFGEYNVMNISAVVTIARSLGIDWNIITKAVSNFRGVPGRIEFISEAEKEHNFQVIVDYAFEPVAMAELYKVVKILQPKRIIHVFGSTGGGRDTDRREKLGDFIGKNADICIVTDEDPYDDNPQDIINEVAEAVEKTGKKENETYFKIIDRGEAIDKAIKLAQAGDLVLVTGKGSEQAMVVKGKLVPWDDREAVRNVL